MDLTTSSARHLDLVATNDVEDVVVAGRGGEVGATRDAEAAPIDDDAARVEVREDARVGTMREETGRGDDQEVAVMTGVYDMLNSSSDSRVVC